MSKAIRNPVAVAMNLRYGRTTTVMKDRRAPRGGSRNDQQDFLQEYEDDVFCPSQPRCDDELTAD